MRLAKLLHTPSSANCFSNVSKLGIRISLGPPFVGLWDPHGVLRPPTAKLCERVGLPIQSTIWSLSSSSRWWKNHSGSYQSLAMQILNSRLPGSNHRLSSTHLDNFLSFPRRSVPSCWVSSNSHLWSTPMDKRQLFALGRPPAQTRKKVRGNRT